MRLLFLIYGYIIIGKATVLPQRIMSEFSVDPSLKYPYPAEWLFKIFIFKCTYVQDMAQNSFFLDKIDHEATKMQANTHFQKSLPGIGILLKTTQTFITIIWELYSVVLKPICEEFIFPVSKIF